MKCDKKIMRLYAVTDRGWLKPGETLYEQVEKALKGGVTCVQLREKNMSDEEFLSEAVEIKKLCVKYSVPLIINDNVDIAVKCGADGIHVGQHDMKATDVRAAIGKDMILGVSAGTVEQAIEAERSGADYLGVGAVFSTTTKLDASAVAHSELKKICAAVSVPVVAIGGISESNMEELKGSGIDGVALVSAIFAAEDIEAACKRLYKLSEGTVKTKIDGAVFDLDGTLLDSMYLWESVGSDYIKSKGLEPEENIREILKPLSLYQSACYAQEKYGITDSKEQIMTDINRIVEKYYLYEVKPKEGVLDFLQGLKDRGVKMCVATATDRYLVEAALKRNNLIDYFDKILTCTEVGHGKDEPHIYNRAAEEWSISPDKIMVFEDASHAAATAKRAGFLVCGIYDEWEKNQTAVIENSDVYIKSFKEAGDYID